MKNFYLSIILLTLIYSIKSQTPGRSDTIDVIHYDINLDITDFVNRQIKGYTVVKTAFKQANIQKIRFDLLKLSVDSIKINEINHTNFSYNDTIIEILLTNPATTLDTFDIKIYYQGEPKKDATWGGFYFVGNNAFNMGVGFESLPHNYGRVWFPCIDEFRDRALYDFHITTSNTNMAVCNGSLVDSTTSGSNKIWHWKLKNTIPTYLASVAISNYVPVVKTLIYNNDTTIAYLYVNPSDTTKAKNSFINLEAIYSTFVKYFGQYKWERIGFVSVLFGSGAMEHATNIAYRQSSIDGTLNDESLYAHELAHSWFGNLFTCSKAEEMWINEGFARYCEAIYRGELYPNNNPLLDGYKTNIRNLQYSVLKSAHRQDGGYFALSNIPQNITYGTTTYDKGGLVVHTLRYYMGDEKFFFSLKQVLNEYSHKSITTNQLRDRLSFYSGINLNDFFDAWINQPGFLHFSIDSLVRVNNQNFEYKYYIKQKLSNSINFGNSNKVQVAFFNSNYEKYVDTIYFSGEYGSKNVNLPFQPIFFAIDYDENMSDAITDYNLFVKTTGNYSCSNAFVTINIEDITDSAFIRVEHNWTKPDDLKYTSTAIKRLSTTRYWTIKGIFPATLKAKATFNYNNATDLDGPLNITSIDSLVMAYRPNAYSEWLLVPFIRVGTATVGQIKIDNLLPGEYAFAIGDKNQVGVIDFQNKSNIKIFPNPAKNILNIENITNEITQINIIDTNGKKLKEIKVNPSDTKKSISIDKFKNGVYFIEFINNSKKIVLTQKFVINN